MSRIPHRKLQCLKKQTSGIAFCLVWVPFVSIVFVFASGCISVSIGSAGDRCSLSGACLPGLVCCQYDLRCLPKDKCFIPPEKIDWDAGKIGGLNQPCKEGSFCSGELVCCEMEDEELCVFPEECDMQDGDFETDLSENNNWN